LREWETAKQTEISTALEKFRASGTAESAIEAHQALVRFHQSSQAMEFRQLLRTKFPDDPKVQVHLGGVCEHLGRLDEAQAYYTRALELSPELPDARVGVAEGHIRANRLDEARSLLDFLEKPGAAARHSLAPLEMLALGFQKAGRHEEAMELFDKLLKELPQLSNHTAFRKMVERSERALKKSGSVLPERKFSWSRLFGNDPTAPRSPGQITWKAVALVAIILMITIVGFAVRNEYVRRHRTIYVVNALEQSAQLEVRGIASIPAPTGVSKMTVPEGRYHLIVRGPVVEEFDLEVSSGYSDRWLSNPAWVVNVGREAIFVITTAHYSKDPQPSTFDLTYGESHYSFPNIDHVFEPLPDSMRMKSSEQRTMTQLDVYRAPASSLFQYLQQENRMGDAWRLAEWQLKRHSDDEDMLHLYISAAVPLRKTEAAESFLRAGLTNRPVEIEWHRAYQSIQRDRKREARLASEYDAMLQAEPGNSALLYLRGRVAPDRVEARRYYDRAIAVDGSNAFPHYAIGYERIAAGDWEAARPFVERAVTLRPKDMMFVSYLGLVRLALREFDGLEKDYRARLKQNPGDLFTVIALCNVLTAAGKTNEVPAVTQTFERFRAGRGEGGYEVISFLRRHVLYLNADFAALEKFGATDRSPLAKVDIVPGSPRAGEGQAGGELSFG
jgi:tetratricopeptide (TPR) repeat protein